MSEIRALLNKNMKKKPYPTVIKRKSKLPTKAELKRALLNKNEFKQFLLYYFNALRYIILSKINNAGKVRLYRKGELYRKGRLFRFFVPFVDKYGKIPKENRDDFINVIEEGSCKQNGGFTAFEARGGYVNQDGKVIREPITIIETYGVNPIPPKRMLHCRTYLSQDSLVVMEGQSFEFIDYKGKGIGDVTRYKPSYTKKR